MKKYNVSIRKLLSPLFLLLCGDLAAQYAPAALPEYPSVISGFWENKGQVVSTGFEPDTGVKYLLCSPGFNVQLRQTGFSYDTYTDTPLALGEAMPGWKESSHHKMVLHKARFIRHFQRVDIELAGCNPHAVITAQGASETYYNYFTAGTPPLGICHVHYYRKIIYHDIYPQIDLEFFTVSSSSLPNNNRAKMPAEYNFIIHPGGNPSDIRLAYKGANSVLLTGNKLRVNVTAGNFTESVPSCYFVNQKGDENIPVRVNYIAWGNNVFSFLFPSCIYSEDINTDLVIDPTPNLDWGTYYTTQGGGAYQIALDGGGNVYVTGETQSVSGVATSGAYQATFTGNVDAFIAKFNPAGTALLWGTYYGGTGDNIANSIALDASDNVYITGYTNSGNGIATPGAYLTTAPGGGDAFVAKFNSAGTSLLWGTYYGGPAMEQGNGIALDASDNVYITGLTLSSSGIATAGGYLSAYSGGSEDAFIAKFNSSGSSLLWATYYGGVGANDGDAIALDASDNIYITGYTTSASGIATEGAYRVSSNSAAGDVFAAKFNSAGTSLLWGTYYGGTDDNQGSSIAIDASDNVYIAGYTDSPSGIATPGAYQTTPGGGYDAFAAEISSTGSSLQWGTYYGGTDSDYAYGIALDASDNVYIVGLTASSSGIATAGAYQATLIGPQDAFIAKFNSSGSSIDWGTYYGGDGLTYGFGIALDASVDVFITGESNSTSGIATAGSYQASNISGGYDVFAAEFNETNGTPLPISLTSFTANYIEENNSVLTAWTVASQLNNQEFVVQKTTDGTSYEEVATVAGAGTTSLSMSYSAIDNSPTQGVSYYRLEQIDVDGNATFFSPVAVYIGNSRNPSLSIYPNPVNSSATLLYVSTDENPLTINIVDITGRIVSSVMMGNIRIGENSFLLNTSSLSRGVYFLQAIESANKTYTVRFVKE